MKTSSTLHFNEVESTIHRHLGITKAFSIVLPQSYLFSALQRERTEDRKEKGGVKPLSVLPGLEN